MLLKLRIETILEAKIQSIDTRLDNSIGAVSSTISGLGDGSSQLRSVGLGYDRTKEHFESSVSALSGL